MIKSNCDADDNDGDDDGDVKSVRIFQTQVKALAR